MPRRRSLPLPSRPRVSRRRAAALVLPIGALAAVALVPLTQSAPRPAGPAAAFQTLPLAAYVGPGTPTSPTPAGDQVDRLVGFNDVHGYLQAGTAGSLYGTAAGGIRQFGNELEQLEAGAPTTAGAPDVALVGAGDQVGASPLGSALFDDEPTIDALHDLHVDFTSVGNHEFDKGPTALLRQQNGGCNSDGRSCVFHYDDTTTGHDPDAAGNPAQGSAQAAGSFAGLGRVDASDAVSQPYYASTDQTSTTTATAGYLAANVVVHATGKPLFPAYGIKTFANGTRVGFIGEVLSATPTIVTPSGVAGLDFLDEATTANTYAAQLKAQGVNTIVLLIHQGGSQTSATANTVDTCNALTGDILPIINRLDPSIGVVISGHTHQAYDCSVPNSSTGKNVLVTSAAKYTQALTSVDLTLQPDGSLYSANARNVTVATAALTKETSGGADACPTSTTGAPLASTGDAVYDHLRTIQCSAELEAAPLANKVVGTITADIRRNGSDSSVETPLGDVIADSQLAQVQQDAAKAGDQKPVIAFMNPGGVRNDLTVQPPANSGAQPGQVTYGEAFSVQPFGNSLTTETLTGAQVYQALEQQFVACTKLGQQSYDKLLPVSNGFAYTIDKSRAACDYVVPGSVTLGGTPIDTGSSYRVEINNFLAAGGDNFTTFAQGTNPIGGAQDIDAFVAYLGAHPNLAPPAANRITVLNSAQPMLPEARLAVLLPVVALALMGGYAWTAGRRRRPAA